MKVLVLASNYPNLKGEISLFYIHTRNVFYLKHGINVEVINFSTKEDYIIDGIRVFSYKTFKNNKNFNYDLLISHAPNLRNHYLFLKKYGSKFSKFLFFFHGHEVLMCNKVYSKPYDYMKIKNNNLKNVYDYIKLKIWHKFFKKYNNKSYYIFVSNWMKEQFLKWVKINQSFISNHMEITYNSIGQEFIPNGYNKNCEKKYDFITIRGNLDGSKYCVDIINKLALNNPKYRFLLIGKGRFFDYNKRAPNLKLIKKNLSHDEIIKFLNESNCALMPTRTDAQGLMACEMATFGIPLITSDIEVCHEIFDNFKNVSFINNGNAENIDIINKYNSIKKFTNNSSGKYTLNNTGIKEIRIIQKIIGDKNDN